MRKIFSLSMFMVALAVACSDHHTEDVQVNGTTNTAAQLNAWVGGRVPVSSATQWADAYAAKYPSQQVTRSFFIGRETLKKLVGMLYDDKPIDGLRFVKGLREGDAETMMVLPEQAGRMLLYATKPNTAARAEDAGTVYDFATPVVKPGESAAATVLHARVGTPLHINDAKLWARAYAKHYPSNAVPKSYFVGRETLNEMLALTNLGHAVDGLRFIKALKENGEEALVIIPVQQGNDLWAVSRGNAAGKTEGSSEAAYDLNAPCPKTCPEDPDGLYEPEG